MIAHGGAYGLLADRVHAAPGSQRSRWGVVLAGVILALCGGKVAHLPFWANGGRGCSTSAFGWWSSIS